MTLEEELLATELLDPGSVPGTLEEEDFAELDDATELLLFSLELLATDEEDFAELELATELLDSSLDELRMTLEEEDSAELEDATELLLFTEELLAIEEELFTLEELTTDEDDSTELEEDTSAGFSSPDGPLEELSSPQATRPKASAKATLVKKFFFIFSFFIFHFLAKISERFKNSLYFYAE